MILDSTCSAKRIFPEFADIRLDVSRTVKPDVVASASCLPFKDGVFSEIYCDPPHRLGRHFGVDKTDSKQVKDYDHFCFWNNQVSWLKFLVKIDKEFRRCLEPNGKVIFKIPDGKRSHQTMIDVDDLRYLSNFKVIQNNRVESNGFFARANVNNGKGHSFIHYVTLQIVHSKSSSSDKSVRV